jgi:hypothetical protein
MKSFAEKITEIKGKTIENVCATCTKRETGASIITLFFTDGSEISFLAGNDYTDIDSISEIQIEEY